MGGEMGVGGWVESFLRKRSVRPPHGSVVVRRPCCAHVQHSHGMVGDRRLDG